MGDKIKVAQNRIRHFGTFSMKNLKNTIMNYCRTKGLDVMDTSHKFKGGDGGEEEIKIVANKKMNHYIKYDVTVEIKATGLKDIELVREGKKIKTQHGKVEIEIKGEVTPDWQGFWDESDFWKFFHKIYLKYIYSFKFKSKWLGGMDALIKGLVSKINENLES